MYVASLNNDVRSLFKTLAGDQGLKLAFQQAKTADEKRKILADAGLPIPSRQAIRAEMAKAVAEQEASFQQGTGAPDLIDQMLEIVGVCVFVGID